MSSARPFRWEWRQASLRVGLLAVALTVVGCGPTPTLAVPLNMTRPGDFTALVFDSTGLVVGGRPLERGDGPWPGGNVLARPDKAEIDVAWIGGACSHRPTITVSGTKEALKVTVAEPRDFNPFFFLPVSCTAVGLPKGVTLSLNQAVQPGHVSWDIAY